MGDASCAVVARARDRIERGGVGVVSREEEAEDDVEECEEAVERVAAPMLLAVGLPFGSPTMCERRKSAPQPWLRRRQRR